MKAQDQQGCSRKMVYEALSRFTVMYGITFGRMKMTLSDLDGALIDIRYQDVVQIIKTIPYVGIVLRTGYLYVFMQNKDQPIVINLPLSRYTLDSAAPAGMAPEALNPAFRESPASCGSTGHPDPRRWRR